MATVAMTSAAAPHDSLQLRSPDENSARVATMPSGDRNSITGECVRFSINVPSYGDVVFALSGIPAPRISVSPTNLGFSLSSATVTTAPSDLVMLPGTLFRVTQTTSAQDLSAEKLFSAGDKLQYLPNFKGSFEREVVTERQLAMHMDWPQDRDGRRQRRSCSPEIVSASQRGRSYVRSGHCGRQLRSCSPEIMSYENGKLGQVGEGKESSPTVYRDRNVEFGVPPMANPARMQLFPSSRDK